MKNMAAAPIRNTKKKKTTWKWFQNNPKYIPEKKMPTKTEMGVRQDAFHKLIQPQKVRYPNGTRDHMRIYYW